MKKTYPIILTKEDVGYSVYIPDFDANTQGDDLTEAIEMARDAIGLLGIDYQDDNKLIPPASAFADVKTQSDDDIVTLVDVDFAEYRRKHDTRTVKKNCTLPSWLCYEAEKAGINFSQTLQDALKTQLNL